DMIVVVTGASAGLGRAVVRAYARQGADVGLIARGVDGLEAARCEVEADGGRAIVLPLDVADADAVDAAAERVERELGPMDVWVNNAMVSVLSPVTETPPSEIKRVTEVTYLGVVYGTLAAMKRMLPRNHGAIVQAGSASAHRPSRRSGATRSPRRSAIGTSRRPATIRSRPTSRTIPIAPTTCGRRWPAITAPTAASAIARRIEARRRGSTSGCRQQR